jgi:hypothetical protein
VTGCIMKVVICTTHRSAPSDVGLPILIIGCASPGKSSADSGIKDASTLEGARAGMPPGLLYVVPQKHVVYDR